MFKFKIQNKKKIWKNVSDKWVYQISNFCIFIEYTFYIFSAWSTFCSFQSFIIYILFA